MWSAAGFLVTLIIGIAAVVQVRGPRVNFYAERLYGMSAAAYRAYAAVSAVFAAVFLASFRWRSVAVPALAIYAVVAILFVSSFLRGAIGEDE